MLKKRLIPVLLLRGGLLVRSELFKIHQIIGNPIHEVERFNEWNVDELVYLDITGDESYDLRREDHRIKGLDDPLMILDAVSKTCFMPLTWGGRIRSVEAMRERFNRGADKIILNTAVISIDVLRHEDGRAEVFTEGGKTPTGKTPVEWAKEVEDRGAGEILLQSIDRDGTGRGYDLDLIHAIASTTSIPVIACSGVGRFEHYADGIRAGASAVAAANIWHFKELTDRAGKRAMAKAGIEVRS
jgi:cyclase